MVTPYSLVLEFTRARQAGQAHSFDFAPQSYLLRSPGGGFESAEFPWTEALLADLRDARMPGCDAEAIHRIGEVLRNFLARVGWDHHERAILDAARTGTPVLLTVRSAAAELYALPWEFVALRSTGQLIGGIPGLLIRYEWPETAAFPDRVEPAVRRGRVLFAWSAAGGAVPADAHLAALRSALGPGEFDPARDVLAHASFGAIDQALDDASRIGPPIDALHLLCHGAALGGSYGLALDDETEPGLPAVVDAGRMQQLLAAHAGMVRLVVLAACDSGNAGEPGNHLGSVAQRVHRAGLKAVVASRYPLSLAGSTRFAQSFYAALARDGAPIERAFLVARDALARDPGQLDWASVQLYGRDADGEATYPLHRPAPVVAAAAPEPPAPPALIFAPPEPPGHVLKDSFFQRLPVRIGIAAVLVGGAVALALAFTGPDPTPTDVPPVVARDTTPQVDVVPEPPPKPPGPPLKPLDPPPIIATSTTQPIADDPPPGPVDIEPRSNGGKATHFGKCPPALVAYFDQFLKDGTAGATRITLSIGAGKDGAIAIRYVRGDRSMLSPAKDQLDAINRGRVQSLGGAALPCKTDRTWLP